MPTVAEYLELPYHRVIQPAESGLWSGHVLELDGVFSEGETAEEAAGNLNVAMGLWIEHELAPITPSRNRGVAGSGRATCACTCRGRSTREPRLERRSRESRSTTSS